MKLRKLTAIIGAAALMSSQGLFAQYTYIGDGSLKITAPGYPPDQAGPYTVHIIAVNSGPSPAYLGNDFSTFCLGTEVNYSPGSTYGYQISTTIQPSGSQPGGVGPPGYVTWDTAWLYSQYRAGLIGDGKNNDAANDALQVAIWTLQGQSLAGIQFAAGDTLATLAGAVQTDLNAASAAALAAGQGNGYNNANGAFGVYALNMFTGLESSPAYVQPELCMIPEPSTMLACALMALPFGASALRILRRNSAA